MYLDSFRSRAMKTLLFVIIFSIAPFTQAQEREYCVNVQDAIKLTKYAFGKIKYLKLINEDGISVYGSRTYSSVQTIGEDIVVRHIAFSDKKTKVSIMISNKKHGTIVSDFFKASQFFSKFQDFYNRWPSKTDCK
tara:strand:+ start:131590 stop:131994 length:405 start_codon:yes stop_codon:yes gene_type:complete